MSADVLKQVSSNVLQQLDMRPRATVQVPRQELPRSVRFFRDEDDLDAFEAAALRAELKPDDRQRRHIASYATGLETSGVEVCEIPLTFLLLHYEREPADQLTVFLPGNVEGQRDVDLAIWRVVAALHLPPDVVVNIFPIQPPIYRRSHQT